ncbi:hypothetical protein M8445_17095 (plasmid) [Deinococcus aquaticus]|uniref:Uncharacterized protein n=1 Tax=Deinococcus aquaticus TaxID=328692 RepID=A0ABY7V7M3_9DEIO|nr:hypothetical protein [Deinococcus aquaticus]WDA60684.1 hypothetical protein M8445_17095 [Deinococcus aquaticus]
MRRRPLALLLLVCAALLAVSVAAAVLARKLPPDPPSCAVGARLTGLRSNLGQYQVRIELPATCPPNEQRLARIITRNGGRIPPIGYFRLGAGYPRRIDWWVFPGAQIQDRPAPNVWVDAPLRGVPAWW